MHRFCSEALELFWNTKKCSTFLLPALVVVHLLMQQAFPGKYTTGYICVANVKPLLHGQITETFTVSVLGNSEGFSEHTCHYNLYQLFAVSTLKIKCL